ncbi:MAG: hypothetical protein SGJ19_29255 [Planctomycetia bacterium]|nr:hypothetical protein [Planctomycetia bacterium]
MRKLIWTLALGTSVCGATAWAAADKPGRVVTRQSWFTIPFQIEPTQRTDRQPVKVQLHVLDPVTGNWRLAEEAAPDEGGFNFRASADGEYGFMVRTYDRTGRLRPERPPAPELIVVVDTAAPVIELTAERGPAGEVTARWRVEDSQLDLESFKLVYQGIEDRDGWQEISTPPLQGDTSGSIYNGEAVLPVVAMRTAMNLRAEVRDKAGNPAVMQVLVQPISGGRPRQTAGRVPMVVRTASGSTAVWDETTPTNVAVSANEETTPGAVRWEANRQASMPYEQAETTGSPYDTKSRYASDRREALPPVNPSPMQSASFTNPSALDSAELIPSGAETMAAGPALGSPTEGGHVFIKETREPYVPPARVDLNTLAQQVQDRRPTFTSQSTLPVPDLHAPATGPVPNTGGERPRMVNSTKFELEYDVESIGPHGVKHVELWGTRDSGLTWKSYGVDTDCRSPLIVSVEGEGMYGFLIAVESGGGNGGERPRAGEKPAIWIGVDKTKPEVELLGTSEGVGAQAGTLLVDWKADDPFLAADAVALLYSEHAGGPFIRIAAGLENSGHYAWAPDTAMPELIYLRLEVRDEAGNVTVVDAPEAVSVQRTQPQGRVRHVRPLDGPSARRVQNPYYR